MKYLIVLITILSLSFLSQAQILEGGVKGGFNFVEKPTIDTENSTLSDIQTKLENEKTAYHLGLWAKVALVGFYLRPEINYAHYNSQFLDAAGNEFNLSSNRLGFPLLIGFQPIKSVFLHGGLVGIYYFGNEDDLRDLENSNYEDFKFGFQIGSGISLGKVSLEGRYEGSFSDRTIELISENSEYQIQSNASQFTISIGYKF